MSAPITALLRAARNAVSGSFFLNGLCFATWISRIPETRSSLGLTNSGLGLLLLALACGSVLALPTTGALVGRFGAPAVIRLGASAVAAGLCLVAVAVGALSVVPLVAVGLFVYGAGTGVWDVAMNVEGAGVEQRMGRSLMPRLHAAFSLGTVVGAGLGALLLWADVPLGVHLAGTGLLALALTLATGRHLLAAEPVEEGLVGGGSLAAWREPRTLLIGAMVLAFAFTEGTANDWLAIALIDGFDLPEWGGVLGFAAFVTAMTLGRVSGPPLLDRYGRVPVLYATVLLSVAGVVLLALPVPALWVLGPVLWGLGASLGFPVGMSAAADDPARAAARVSVVSTIGYAAFLAGPPLVGFLADDLGALRALLAVAALLVPAALLIPAAREPHPAR